MPKGLRATSSAWLRPAWVPAAALVMSSVHAADLGLSAGTRLGSFSDGSIGLHVPPTRDFEHASDAARLAQTDDSLRQLPSAPPVPAPYESAGRKSYLIPALEIVGFDFLLNRFDNLVAAARLRVSCRLDPAQPARQLGRRQRPVHVNQLGHPYQGSMYHGFARSAGLELLGVARLHIRRQRVVGDRRRDDPALAQRPDQYRHRRQLPRRGAVPDGEPGARAGDGLPPFWRELGAAVDLAADRLQPARLRRPLRPDLPEPRPGLLQPAAARLQRHDAERRRARRRATEAQRALVDFCARLRAAGQARLHVHAAVRLLQLPGHRVERATASRTC